MKILLAILIFITLTGCEERKNIPHFIQMNGTRYLMSMPVSFVEDHSSNASAGFYKIDFSKFSLTSQMTDSSFQIIDVGIFNGMNIKYVKDNIQNQRAVGFYLFLDKDNQIIPSGNMVYQSLQSKVIGVIDVDETKSYDLSKMSTLELLKLSNQIEMMAKAKQP